MIWAKEETMSRAEIEAVQLARLKEAVTRNYERVPAYRAKKTAAQDPCVQRDNRQANGCGLYGK